MREQKETKLVKRLTALYFYFQIKVKVNVNLGSEDKYLSHFAWMSLVWCSPAHHEALSRLRPGFKSRYEHHSIDLLSAMETQKEVLVLSKKNQSSPTKSYEQRYVEKNAPNTITYTS